MQQELVNVSLLPYVGSTQPVYNSRGRDRCTLYLTWDPRRNERVGHYIKRRNIRQFLATGAGIPKCVLINFSLDLKIDGAPTMLFFDIKSYFLITPANPARNTGEIM